MPETGPLAEYHRKRDFALTPEPAGQAGQEDGTPGGQRRFVVQRHRATRLHYDFRLEMSGVLASWAVPKGPTLDPGARRMAVHVEDHPLEYFDFEGVIPAKQYGGGDVIVWDWGFWEPEELTPDPVAAIAAGELKFVLHGQRLRGRFTIVRTSGRGAGREPADGQDLWLLIHKRDEWAAPGWDAEDLPTSVKSGLTNDEVKAETPAIWVSAAPAGQAQIDLSAAVRAPLAPVEPMVATLASHPFSHPDWIFEVKWDGFRVQAVVDAGSVRLLTRGGQDGATYFPNLLSPPDWIAAEQALVDGEVVALDAAGRPDFGLLQERITARKAGRPASLVYQAFDLLHVDGRSLLAVPLVERKRLLRLLLREDARVRFCEHIAAEGEAFFAAAAEQGLEGIMAKRADSAYEPGTRSTAWLKLKVRPEQELVVGGWTPATGRPRDLGALVVGVYQGDALRYAGKVGSGFSAGQARELLSKLGALRTDGPAFDPPPPRTRGRSGDGLAGVTWVRPELVVRAQLGGWSRDGMVRQAAYKGIERGRDPRSVQREEAVSVTPADPGSRPGAQPGGAPGGSPASGTDASASATGGSASGAPSVAQAVPGTDDPQRHPWQVTPDELAALAALPEQGVWEVGGQALKLTNLDKVLFPPRDDVAEAPVTKRALIAYFTSMAPAMLPHLVDRPLNLHRFPNGVGKPGFWQKDIPASAPKWLRIWHETGFRERADRAPNDHLVADQVATLGWLANQAAFEVHAWTSTCVAPWVPTFALIDIDPGPATTWEETLTLARLYRTALEHLGVRGYPKTTGSRGIQAWIPVVRDRYEYEQTSAWVEKLSRAVGATVPDLVSWEWSKRDRAGKARLDYTQNAPIKTLVAPYAVRPLPGAPVSMPIRWEELDDPGLRPDRWTVGNALERIAQVGDLFAAAQTDAQELPPL